jgi:hypothetical protein
MAFPTEREAAREICQGVDELYFARAALQAAPTPGGPVEQVAAEGDILTGLPKAAA